MKYLDSFSIFEQKEDIKDYYLTSGVFKKKYPNEIWNPEDSVSDVAQDVIDNPEYNTYNGKTTYNPEATTQNLTAAFGVYSDAYDLLNYDGLIEKYFPKSTKFDKVITADGFNLYQTYGEKSSYLKSSLSISKVVWTSKDMIQMGESSKGGRVVIELNTISFWYQPEKTREIRKSFLGQVKDKRYNFCYLLMTVTNGYDKDKVGSAFELGSRVDWVDTMGKTVEGELINKKKGDLNFTPSFINYLTKYYSNSSNIDTNPQKHEDFQEHEKDVSSKIQTLLKERFGKSVKLT